MKIAIGIATTGRREQMGLTLKQISLQSRLPDHVIICPATHEDLDLADLQGLPYSTEVVEGGRGLTRQRNAILRAADEFDAMLFLDDDFYPASSYLALLEKGLTEHPNVVIMTNHPIADGATGPGISHQEAIAHLRNAPELSVSGPVIAETYGGYGCNLTVRLGPVRRNQIAFDVNLPLYGWLEDIDFSRQMATHGRIATNHTLIGVHLGTKKGRTSGLKFGYSQWANPIYLYKKGTMNFSYAISHILKNTLMNIAKTPNPEHWIDRYGRLSGNFKAIMDAIRGKLNPRNILDF